MCVSIAEPQFPHLYNEEFDLDVLIDPSGSQFLNDTTRCFSSLGLRLCICNQQGVEMAPNALCSSIILWIHMKSPAFHLMCHAYWIPSGLT